MPDRAAIIAKAAGAFDKVRPGLMPGYRAFLLKSLGETSKFTAVAEATDGFWIRWSEYREQNVFMLASNQDEWTDRVAQTSHFAFGVPDGDSKIDVYSLSADARDRIPPNGANLFWKLYGTREKSLRFEVPA